jgi:hypothetical protein
VLNGIPSESLDRKYPKDFGISRVGASQVMMLATRENDKGNKYYRIVVITDTEPESSGGRGLRYQKLARLP